MNPASEKCTLVGKVAVGPSGVQAGSSRGPAGKVKEIDHCVGEAKRTSKGTGTCTSPMRNGKGSGTAV